MIKRIGVVGAGLMGLAVTQRLIERGYHLVARDIDPAAEQRASNAGAEIAATPADVARRVEAVITLVVDDRQTESVLFGPDGIVGALAPGGIVMVSSTLPPEFVAALGPRLAQAGLRLLDAPVSGGPARARAGTMSVMAAGGDDIFADFAEPLAAMAGRVFRVGTKPGDGATVKIVNNMIAGSTLVAAAEGMALGQRLGLDPAMLHAVVMASAGSSFMFGDRMGRMIAGDLAPRAATHILAKDIAIARDTAARSGFATPVASLAAEIFANTIAAGYRDADDASVIHYFES